jgi:3-oxoacyl-[acyl-carrier protein] reductase
MVERKKGFVVNVSSVAARNGGGLGALPYAAAKGAVSTMTKGLAKEFAPFGIRINAVSPGTIDTNYHRNFSNDQMLSAIKAATPMARLGTAEEVADVILFLCRTKRASFKGRSSKSTADSRELRGQSQGKARRSPWSKARRRQFCVET